jgi:hypothetical protein
VKGEDVRTALSRIGQLLLEAERALVSGDVHGTDLLLNEAAFALADTRELQRRAEDDSVEAPFMTATRASCIIDAPVGVVPARCPLPLVDVALAANGAGEHLPPKKGVEPRKVG